MLKQFLHSSTFWRNKGELPTVLIYPGPPLSTSPIVWATSPLHLCVVQRPEPLLSSLETLPVDFLRWRAMPWHTLKGRILEQGFKVEHHYKPKSFNCCTVLTAQLLQVSPQTSGVHLDTMQLKPPQRPLQTCVFCTWITDAWRNAVR